MTLTQMFINGSRSWGQVKKIIKASSFVNNDSNQSVRELILGDTDQLEITYLSS